MEIFDTILNVARDGFDQVNAVQGLIIALVGALILPNWQRLPMIVVGATVVHVVVDMLLPVLAGGAALRLPEFLEISFWRYVATLLVGYLVIITAFVLVRKLVLRR